MVFSFRSIINAFFEEVVIILQKNDSLQQRALREGLPRDPTQENCIAEALPFRVGNQKDKRRFGRLAFCGGGRVARC